MCRTRRPEADPEEQQVVVEAATAEAAAAAEAAADDDAAEAAALLAPGLPAFDCSACTYSNQSGFTHCEICMTPRVHM